MEDPIYAAIDTHFDCWHRCNDAVHFEFGLPLHDPQTKAAEMETARLSNITSDRFRDLMATSPTTVAGVAALLEHICGMYAACDSEFDEKTLIAVMEKAASALRDGIDSR